MKKPHPLTLEAVTVKSERLAEMIVVAVASLRPASYLKRVIAAAVLVVLAGCGARTGLRVPAEPVVTFQRAVGSTGSWRWHIFQASPVASAPEGRIRVEGVGTLTHAAHPGGDWLAFVTQEGLFVQDGRGYRTRRSSDRGIGSLDWSPDARRLAFDKDDRVWVMDSGGGGAATPLTPELSDPFGVRAGDPSWTPDGGRLFLVRFRMGLDGRGDPFTFGHELWTVADDGSDLRLVHAGTPEPSLAGIAVSRDGASVLYVTGPERSPSVVRLDLASGTTSTIVTNAKEAAFSASGRHLAFVRNGQVWICAYDGNACAGERQISDGTHDHTLSWVGW